MVILKVILIWLILGITKMTERYGLKTVSWISASIVLVLFGDTLIPAVFHVLHILWEMIESVFEHFLETTFHLTPRQAEIIVAWMGILTITGFGLKLLYHAYYWSIILFTKLQDHLTKVKADFEANPVKVGLILSLVSIGGYGATFLFL